jgi:hypothetical protein
MAEYISGVKAIVSVSFQSKLKCDCIVQFANAGLIILALSRTVTSLNN